MRSRNIKDTFDIFSPTEEQRGKIYNSIIKSQKSNKKRIGLRLKIKFSYALVICFILMTFIVALLIISTDKLDGTLSKLLGSKYPDSQSSNPSDNNNLASIIDLKYKFNGFTLIAYAADEEDKYLNSNFANEAEKQILTHNTKILLAKYSPIMSNVPGLPFTIEIADKDESNNEIQSIDVSVDYGSLIRWNSSTGEVLSEGQLIKIDAGETIYWSPIHNGSDIGIEKIIINVEAVNEDIIIGSQNIYITQDEIGDYYAILGDLHL